ncbi:MAG: hypothetical protein IJR44_02705 [Neisseriaceae bacterium]|nr:hypothetical protein [Neisseriaceae bacterium]
MKSVKSIMIVLAFITVFFISNVLYGGSFVSETTSNNDVDFAKIAKEIKRKEARPPISLSEEGIDVSKYFIDAINKNEDVYKLKNKLTENGYFVDWRDKYGKITEDKKANELNALFVFRGFFFRHPDTGIILSIEFDEFKSITNIKAIYFTYSLI